ncbi:MAG: hypothetical protein V4480_00845 [Patescibacteria group bacterium]
MDIVTNVSAIATSGVASVWLWVGNFVVLLVLTLIMLAFSYRAGRGGLVSLLMAFYAGYAIYIVFPYTSGLVAAGDTKLIKAIISIIIYAVCTFIPFHFIRRLTGHGLGSMFFVPRLVLSFLSAAFLLSLAYHVFHVSNIYTFPGPINNLFAPNEFFFWWFIAPLVGLLIFVR